MSRTGRHSFDRIDDLGPQTAFLARGECTVGVVVRLLGKSASKSEKEKLLSEDEWIDAAHLIHMAPSMREALKKAVFFAEVEAANVDQTPAERDRWLEIKSILQQPFESKKAIT